MKVIIHKMIIGLLITFSVHSLANAASSAAQNLTKALQDMETFSADFEQTISNKAGKILSYATGKVYVQRPGRFNWETNKPNNLKIIADGQYIWTYDIELEQIIRQNAKTMMIGSPAALLAGQPMNLEKEFNVTYAKNSYDRYILQPRVQDALFHNVKIEFKNNQLVLMDMKDGLGQSIRTRFSKVKVNTHLDSQWFVFHPPKGMDIIKYN